MIMKTEEERKLYKAAWRKENREKCRLICQRWRANNPWRVIELALLARQKNGEKKKIRARELYALNRDHVLMVKAEWRKNNPEKTKAIKAKVRSNPDFVERERAKHREWLKLNSERMLTYRKERRGNPVMREKENTAHSAWMKKHPGKRSLYERKRKAIKLGAEGMHTEEDIRRLYFLQKGKCVVCKIKLNKYHVDHIMPLALGGSNAAGNIQLLCPACNMSKHSKHPIDFMQSRGFLL